MANTELKTLVTDVLLEVQGAPSFTIVNALRRATIDLCEQAHVWEQSDDPLVAVSGQSEQDLPLPNSAELVQLLSLHRKTIELTPVTVGDIFTLQGDASDSGTWGEPLYYSADTVTSVRLHPIPSSTEVLNCRMALKPKMSATSIPAEIAVRWRNALLHGAKYYLCMMAAEWGDPDRAIYYRNLFDAEIARAKLMRFKGYGNPSLRVKSVFFGV
jgi:hypothetical protein